ncbi:MAG: hypothetical protein M3Z31_03420 [Pseudomonadota bacterium]|nr:hypothetical protein [Pseudomonadota bacterium]
MASPTLRWLLLGLVAWTCGQALAAPAAPSRFGLSPAASEIYQRWVLAMCIGGDERTLTADLRSHAAELAPAFRRAVTEGPSADETLQVREAALALHERRPDVFRSGVQITGVSEADLARFTRQPREVYVADQVKRFVTGYRANAVAALGIVSDAPGRAFLARLARNRADPLAAAAREALRTAESPR